MSIDSLVALLVSIALIAYLVIAMLRPRRSSE